MGNTELDHQGPIGSSNLDIRVLVGVEVLMPRLLDHLQEDMERLLLPLDTQVHSITKRRALLLPSTDRALTGHLRGLLQALRHSEVLLPLPLIRDMPHHTLPLAEEVPRSRLQTKGMAMAMVKVVGTHLLEDHLQDPLGRNSPQQLHMVSLNSSSLASILRDLHLPIIKATNLGTEAVVAGEAYVKSILLLQRSSGSIRTLDKLEGRRCVYDQISLLNIVICDRVDY